MISSTQPRGPGLVAALIIIAAAPYLSSCSVTNQVVSGGHSTEYDLPVGNIAAHGLAMITPSAATGQETNRQALAMGFAEVIQDRYPDANVVALPQLLSAVNRSGLAGEYTQMFNDYETTGILERDSLQRLAAACQVRYIGHLDLQDFDQWSNRRFGVLGLRLVETKQASMRVFLQIWDAQTGNIVWEGSEELAFAYDTGMERPVTFTTVVEQAANAMLDRFPQGDHSHETRHVDLHVRTAGPMPVKQTL